MRIVVDRDRCEGLGMCEAMAHTFFEVDDDEVMHVLDESPAEEHRRHVRAAPPHGRRSLRSRFRGDPGKAVQSCPVLALTLTG